MKKIFIPIAFALLLLTACSKKTEEQLKIDTLLDQYDGLVTEVSDFVYNLQHAQDKSESVTADDLLNLLANQAKLAELQDAISEFNAEEFTKAQAARLEALKKTLTELSEQITDSENE